MLNTLIGHKIEMSQVFRDDGEVAPVTLLSAGPCRVTQVKTLDRDGYNAVQLGYGHKHKLSQTLKGHLRKSGGQSRFLREVRLKDDEDANVRVGDEIKAVDVFNVGDIVDVIGTSKGKGFAGVVKRWGFHGGPKTHGQGLCHRAPGSIGSQGVGRVFKGKKMAGRMGHERVTMKGLEVVEIDEENHLVKVKGGVPGSRNSLILVRKSVSG